MLDSTHIRFLTSIAFAVVTGGPIHSQAPDGPLETVGPRDAVTIRFLADPALDPTRIKVTQSNGVVRLSGTVRNLLERQRAEDLAAAVRGVDEVDNQLEVEDADAPSDEALRQRILQALQEHPSTAMAAIDINVERGVVELIGTFETAAEASYAADVIRGIHGTRGLREEISIEPAERKPDPQIKAEIESALRWDSMVEASDIIVSVRDGVVTLDGHVRSLAEKHAALQVAAMPGVRAVDAYALTVAPVTVEPETIGPAPSSALQEAVQSAINRDPELRRAGIVATVDNGTVTLQGTVDRLALADRANRAARRITSVREVRSALTIAASDRPDEALAAGVQNILSRDPYVSDDTIEVAVNNGVATLRGRVGSAHEKLHATALASQLPGVRKIVNELTAPDGEIASRQTTDPGGAEVLPQAPASDARIRAAIREGLWWQPSVDESGIDFEVENGVATLRGRIPSLAQAEAAVETAYVAGAVRVINELEVGRHGRNAPASGDQASTR